MNNPYVKYYVVQAGTGASVYRGVRFQRGHGFFGRLIKGAALPILKYLSRAFLSTGIDVAKDALGGENVKESAKRRFKETGKRVANEGLEKAQSLLQKGSGKKKKRASKTSPKKSKKRKPTSKRTKPRKPRKRANIRQTKTVKRKGRKAQRKSSTKLAFLM